MKKIFSFIVGLILSFISFAQAPSMFNYQAVVRNSNNQPVVNQKVGMRISILYAKPFGNAVYQEYHSPNTNENGLVSIIIGAGDPPITGYMDSIKWGDGPYYLLTEIDPTGGSNYTITGSTQLLSVPYAMHAGNGVPKLKADKSGLNQTLYNCLDGPQWGPCPPKITLDSFGQLDLNNIYALFGTIRDRGSFSISSISAKIKESNNQNATEYTLEGFQTIDNLIRIPLAKAFQYKWLMPNTSYEIKVKVSTTDPINGLNLSDEKTYYYTTDTKIPGDTVMVNGRETTVAYVNHLGEVFGIGWLANNVYFGCDGITLPGRLETNPSGRENTADIVAACTTSAAKIADQWVSQDNFRDWFMPSISELNAIIAGSGIYYVEGYPHSSGDFLVGSSNANGDYFASYSLNNNNSNTSELNVLEGINSGYPAKFWNTIKEKDRETFYLLGLRKIKQL